jgi:hypothetical protein
MPKAYHCKLCKYTTKDTSNYTRHLKSDRHKKVIEPKCETTTDIELNECNIFLENHTKLCEFCNMRYSRLDALKRHQKYCSQKKILEKDKEIETMDNKLDNYSKELTRKETELIKKDEEIRYYRQLLEIGGNKDGVSKFSYISETYTDTEPVRELTYCAFKKINKIQYIDDNNKTYEEMLVDDMLLCYRKKTFHKYISKAIIKIFKNNDKKLQKIWVTDPSRLKFMIRVKEENIIYWKADCDGNIVLEQLIKPILIKSCSLIEEYMSKYCFPNINEISEEKKNIIMKDREDLMELKDKITNDKFDKKILKYIAPKFIVENIY